MTSTTERNWGPGHVVAGRYRIVSELGRGGMGSVWRAEHVTLESPVAIKVIDPSIATGEETLARFMREAKAAAALRSPHVVQVLDYGAHEGVPYIAMEMLEGESLADRLERLGKLSPAETARVVTHIARAISKAHEAGIIHRDLKPDNVFIVHNEDDEIAKVLDFGIAKATGTGLESMSRTRTGALLGSPYYMSPEQAEGLKELDHRSDLWSMAVIAFECLVGRRPFESDALGDLMLQICSRPIPIPSQMGEAPPGFDEWFARAATRDRDRRFQSARELARALREVLDPTDSNRVSQDGPRTGVPVAAQAGAHRRDRGRTGFALTTGESGVTATAAAAPQDGTSIPIRKQSRAVIAIAVAGVALLGGAVSVMLGSAESGDDLAASTSAAAQDNAGPQKSGTTAGTPHEVEPAGEETAAPDSELARADDRAEPGPSPGAEDRPTVRLAEPSPATASDDGSEKDEGPEAHEASKAASHGSTPARPKPRRRQVTVRNARRASVEVSFICDGRTSGTQVPAGQTASLSIAPGNCRVRCSGVGQPSCPLNLRAGESAIVVQ